jgi:cytochrome c-type biogenesis protein CcmH/NrfG
MNQKVPNHVETALAAARIAITRGQTATAIAAFRAALARQERIDIVRNIAAAHLALGEGAKAVGVLETWMRKHPADREGIKALAEAQYRTGNLPAARQAYQRAIELEPNNPALLNNMASLLVRMNDKSARQYAERALKLAPQNALVNDTLGWILVVQEGQIDAGLRYLRDARLRDPSNSEIRYHLAYALARAGRKTEAQEELSQVLGKANKYASAEDVLKLKKELGL